jgi:hypothetical protein
MISVNGKRDKTLLPERPFGCFAQKGPVLLTITHPASEDNPGRVLMTYCPPMPWAFSRVRPALRNQAEKAALHRILRTGGVLGSGGEIAYL